MKAIHTFALSAAALAATGAATRKLLWDPPAPRVRAGVRHVACVGDSITFGAGVIPRHRALAWPTLLQRKLGSSTQVLNFGLSGRTLLSTGDMPYIREAYYPKTFQCKPEVVLVLLGANDAKPYNWDEARYEQELKAFLERYIACGARVVVMRPSKCFVQPGKTEVGYDILNENVLKEQPIISRVAAQLGIQAVDLYAFTQDHPEWFDDGVHPNKAGNEAFAAYIYQEVFQAEQEDF